MMQQHIRTIPIPKCPDCEEEMVLRTRKADSVKFWGCSTFPECRGTRNIKPDGTPEEDDELFDDWGWWADPNDVKNTL